MAVFHRLAVISCLYCTTMLKIPMSDEKGRFEHESTKKINIGRSYKSYKQIKYLSTLHIECFIAFLRYNCTEQVKQLLFMMFYILQSHKNQLLCLHPAEMNQDFIICSFGSFSQTSGYQLSILCNNTENTHVWCKRTFWAQINQKNQYYMIL